MNDDSELNIGLIQEVNTGKTYKAPYQVSLGHRNDESDLFPDVSADYIKLDYADLDNDDTRIEAQKRVNYPQFEQPRPQQINVQMMNRTPVMQLPPTQPPSIQQNGFQPPVLPPQRRDQGPMTIVNPNCDRQEMEGCACFYCGNKVLIPKQAVVYKCFYCNQICDKKNPPQLPKKLLMCGACRTVIQFTAISSYVKCVCGTVNYVPPVGVPHNQPQNQPTAIKGKYM